MFRRGSFTSSDKVEIPSNPIYVNTASEVPVENVAQENVEYEIDEVVYANCEEQMIRKKCFGHYANSERLGLIEKRYS